MGDAAALSAVADAGPLIHLHEISALSFLAIFSELQVPDAVWEETVSMGRVPAVSLGSLPGLRRLSLPPTAVNDFVRRECFERLQRGECEALLLCRNGSVPLLLTDDMQVRQAAQRIGITPVGSLGIIVRAMRSGLIQRDAAERHLLALHDVSSLFVTRAIVDLALEQIRQ